MNRMNNRMRRTLLSILVSLAMVAAVLTPGSPASAATCPCSIWPSTAVPGTPADSDTSAVEVGSSSGRTPPAR